jgi:hypothetical protein
MTTVDRHNEQRIRRLARRHGYALRKSRQWRHVPNLDNFGDFMLIDPLRNTVIMGERFNATLDDIKTFFREAEAA